MKKLFLILFCGTLTSCYKEPQPIEKYQDKGFILIENATIWSPSEATLILKNKDSIIEVAVHPFDIEGLKVGDTLKSKL